MDLANTLQDIRLALGTHLGHMEQLSSRLTAIQQAQAVSLATMEEFSQFMSAQRNENERFRGDNNRLRQNLSDAVGETREQLAISLEEFERRLPTF